MTTVAETKSQNIIGPLECKASNNNNSSDSNNKNNNNNEVFARRDSEELFAQNASLLSQPLSNDVTPHTVNLFAETIREKSSSGTKFGTDIELNEKSELGTTSQACRVDTDQDNVGKLPEGPCLNGFDIDNTDASDELVLTADGKSGLLEENEWIDQSPFLWGSHSSAYGHALGSSSGQRCRDSDSDEDSYSKFTSSGRNDEMKTDTCEDGTVDMKSSQILPLVGDTDGSSKGVSEIQSGLNKPCRATPAREAVDPAKYFTLTDEPDGTKYACSKCGNVYKWRKSLNKHWKEKHDGETPEPKIYGGGEGVSLERKLPAPNHPHSGSSKRFRVMSMNKSSENLSVPSANVGRAFNSARPNMNSAHQMHWGTNFSSCGRLGSHPNEAHHNSLSPGMFGKFSLGATGVRKNKLQPQSVSAGCRGNFETEPATVVVHPYRPTSQSVTPAHTPRSGWPWQNLDPFVGDSSSIKSALYRSHHIGEDFSRKFNRNDASIIGLPMDMSRGPQSFMFSTACEEDDKSAIDLSKKSIKMFSSPVMPAAYKTNLIQDEPLDFSTKQSSMQLVASKSAADINSQWLGQGRSALHCSLCPAFTAYDKLELEQHMDKQHMHSELPFGRHPTLSRIDTESSLNSVMDHRHLDPGNAADHSGDVKHGPNHRFSCTSCRAGFDTMTELNRHFAVRHVEALYDTALKVNSGSFESLAMESSHGGVRSAIGAEDLGASAGTQLYRYLTMEPAKPQRQQFHSCIVCGSSHQWLWMLEKHYATEHMNICGLNPYKKNMYSSSSQHSEQRLPVSSYACTSRIGLGSMRPLPANRIKAENSPGNNNTNLDSGSSSHQFNQLVIGNSNSVTSRVTSGGVARRPVTSAVIVGSQAVPVAAARGSFDGGVENIVSVGDDDDDESDGGSDVQQNDEVMATEQRAVNGTAKRSTTHNSAKFGNDLHVGRDTAIVIPEAPDDVTSSHSSDSQSSSSTSQSLSASPQPMTIMVNFSTPSPSSSVGGSKGASDSAEGNLPFKCDLCEYRARWPSEMTQHRKNHSNEKPYRCPQCSYRSKWKWDVVKHQKRCGPSGCTGLSSSVDDTTSQRGSDTSSTPSPLRRSKKTSHNSKARNSTSNSASAKFLAEMRQPIGSCNTSNDSLCPIGGGPMNDEPDRPIVLGVREVLSNGPPNVTVFSRYCTESGKTDKLDLSEHSTSRTDDVKEDVIEGVERLAAMVLKTASNQSQNVHTDNQQEGYGRLSVGSSLVQQGSHLCAQCPFQGHSPAELKRHLRVHSDEKPYACGSCNYSSKWKCDLKKHLKAYGHFSAIPLLYGGHGRKPGCDWPEGAQASAEQSKTCEVFQKTDCKATAADEQGNQLGSALNTTGAGCVIKKEPGLEEIAKEEESDFGGISAGGWLRCKHCDFEALTIALFLSHKTKNHSCGTGGHRFMSTSTANKSTGLFGSKKLSHRRRASKHIRVVSVVANRQCEVADIKREVPSEGEKLVEEKAMCFWESLGLRRRHHSAAKQAAAKLDQIDQETVERRTSEGVVVNSDTITANKILGETAHINNNSSTNSGETVKSLLMNNERAFPTNRRVAHNQMDAHVIASGGGLSGNATMSSSLMWVGQGQGHATDLSKKPKKRHRVTDGYHASSVCRKLSKLVAGLPGTVGFPMKSGEAYEGFEAYKKRNENRYHRYSTNPCQSAESIIDCDGAENLSMSASRVSQLYNADCKVGPIEMFKDQVLMGGVSKPVSGVQAGEDAKQRWAQFEGRSRQRVTTTEAEDAAGMSKRKRKLRSCAKCGYVTDNLTTLQRHAAKHGSGGRHQCERCDYSVDRQHILDYHVRIVHDLPATFVLPPRATSFPSPTSPVTTSPSARTSPSTSSSGSQGLGRKDLSVSHISGTAVPLEGKRSPIVSPCNESSRVNAQSLNLSEDRCMNVQVVLADEKDMKVATFAKPYQCEDLSNLASNANVCSGAARGSESSTESVAIATTNRLVFPPNASAANASLIKPVSVVSTTKSLLNPLRFTARNGLVLKRVRKFGLGGTVKPVGAALVPRPEGRLSGLNTRFTACKCCSFTSRNIHSMLRHRLLHHQSKTKMTDTKNCSNGDSISSDMPVMSVSDETKPDVVSLTDFTVVADDKPTTDTSAEVNSAAEILSAEDFLNIDKSICNSFVSME